MHTAITCIRRVTCEWVVGGCAPARCLAQAPEHIVRRVGEFRRGRSPRRRHPGRALQGRCIVVARCPGCQTTSDGLLGTLKHGRGQETANTSPTREIGMACRPHT
jgi:hypothetical protein